MLIHSFTGSSVHPLSQRRVVVVSRDPAPEELSVVERGRAFLASEPHSLSSGKADLIIRVVDRLATYYHHSERWEMWLRHVVRRENLASTGIGRGCAILDYRLPIPLVVEVPPADWWWFLIPQGCDWDSLDGEPVHALCGVTCADPNAPGTRLRELERLSGCLRKLRTTDWQAFARLAPLDAIRCFNGLHETVREDRARTSGPH